MTGAKMALALRPTESESFDFVCSKSRHHVVVAYLIWVKKMLLSDIIILQIITIIQCRLKFDDNDIACVCYQIVLVDSNTDHIAKKHVFSFLHYPMADHTRDEEHAAGIMKLLEKAHPGITIDGCLAFWEDCVPLAAMMAEVLELNHLPGMQAARNAKSKALTQQVLWAMNKEPPHGMPPKLYASPSVKIDTVEDLEQAVEQVSKLILCSLALFIYLSLSAIHMAIRPNCRLRLNNPAV